MDACAVLSGKTVVAVSGRALAWQQIVTAGAEQGGTLHGAAGDRTRAAARGAARTYAMPGLTVYVVRRLDEKLAHELSEQVGVAGAPDRLPHLHQRRR